MEHHPDHKRSFSLQRHRIGIFGGTFDPVHWGHLIIAEAALGQAMLDRVLWVPTVQPPHKSRSSLLDFNHRLAMVQQAIADHPRFLVSTIEKTQSGQSFAIDTFLGLRQEYPDRDWHWVIGEDALQSLPKWYRHQELIPQCCWLIAPRPLSAQPTPDRPLGITAMNSRGINSRGSTELMIPRALTHLDFRWDLLQIPPLGVSSSLIRAYVAQGRSIRYLVPDIVREYIATHSLYQT